MLEEQGDFQDKPCKKYFRKIDPKKLEGYLNEHPDAYLREIAGVFGCSIAAVSKALKSMGCTKKKERHIQRTGRLKSRRVSATKAKDKSAFRSKHEPELVIFEVARSTFLPFKEMGDCPASNLFKLNRNSFHRSSNGFIKKEQNPRRKLSELTPSSQMWTAILFQQHSRIVGRWNNELE